MSEPKEQCEVLMNEMLGFALRMLSTQGQFHPYGGYMYPNGKVVHVGLPSPDGSADGSRRVAALVNSFQESAARSNAIAFAVVSNVARKNQGVAEDAIRIFLEHESGYCADVYFAYTLFSGSSPEVLGVTAQQGVPCIFGPLK